MEQLQILNKTCEICGKVISSLYEKQLDFIFYAHLHACKKKKGKIEVENEKGIITNSNNG